MTHHILSVSDLDLDLKEVYLCMGYEGNEPDTIINDMVLQVFEEVKQICIPQYLYDIYPGNVVDKHLITIGETSFKPGKTIVSYLPEATVFCVFVATAGKEFELYKQKARSEDLMKEFILDSFGSVIAETCVRKISEKLDDSIKLQQTYPYSPGYCGWKLDEQQKLFSLLPPSPCGITLTPSFLMLPIKSVSGIIGLGQNIERKAYACSICESVNCYKKRTEVI